MSATELAKKIAEGHPSELTTLLLEAYSFVFPEPKTQDLLTTWRSNQYKIVAFGSTRAKVNVVMPAGWTLNLQYDREENYSRAVLRDKENPRLIMVAEGHDPDLTTVAACVLAHDHMRKPAPLRGPSVPMYSNFDVEFPYVVHTPAPTDVIRDSLDNLPERPFPMKKFTNVCVEVPFPIEGETDPWLSDTYQDRRTAHMDASWQNRKHRSWVHKLGRRISSAIQILVGK